MNLDHPKRRRRRRRADRHPISGRLCPGDHFKGNVGRISHKLFAELFQSQPISDQPSSDIHYVAITPWSALSQNLVEDATWTILPIQAWKDKGGDLDTLDDFSIHFSASSLALQTFAEALYAYHSGRSKVVGDRGIEVCMLDVQPLVLDTIFVTVDGSALEKHEEVQKKFGGGFNISRANGYVGKGKGKAKAVLHQEVNGNEIKDQMQEQEQHLISAIRSALQTSLVIRQDDLLLLPLPGHPITHAPLPPAKITLCEPVNQGLLSDTTRIIVNKTPSASVVNRSLPGLAARRFLSGMSLEEDNDTSNDQFFSAAENGDQTRLHGSDSTHSSLDSDDSDTDSGESSDDSMQNTISMKSPSLLAQSSGILSSRIAATPREKSQKINGVSTPGSVFSNYTATTARQGPRTMTTLFTTQSLSIKIPDDMLHPKPKPDEDEEARVFVDVKTLIRLGCFSGDWMQLEVASAPKDCSSGVLATDIFRPEHFASRTRPAKVYGLTDLNPSLTSRHSSASSAKAVERRSSVITTLSLQAKTPIVWLSPILLANIGYTKFLRIGPLKANAPELINVRAKSAQSKVTAALIPPIAKEINLLRLSTPLTTERALQNAIFTALKQYFESKRRVLRERDLIALPIDTSISRLITQPTETSDTSQEVEEMMSLPSYNSSSMSASVGIAWFRVGQIVLSESNEPSESLSASIWDKLACIEPTVTRMRQSGSESSKIPALLFTPWERYLGTKLSARGLGPRSSLATRLSMVPNSDVPPLQRRLRELLAAATSPRALHLGMDPIIILLHSTQRKIGKATLLTHAASDLGLHVFDIDGYEMSTEGGSAGDIKTEALLKLRVERAVSCGPLCTAVLLRHVEALAADRMVTALKEISSDIRVLIATTTDVEGLPDGMRSLFSHELEIGAPDEGERENLLRMIVEDQAINTARDVDLASIAVKSAALVAGDLVDIVERATIARQNRLEQLFHRIPNGQHNGQILIRDILVSGGESIHCVTKADFDIAVDAARKNFADAIGAPKIPSVSWEDVGGLENVKEAVMETVQLPLERPELFAKGMKKRSGILFYGPPGTGKTLLAKAIATEFSLNFFSVKGPELLNMYIGESEANVRRVFQRARDAKPCVVFFDELDSVAPKRGNQGDSGGVMDRIVSQLLAELDGMSDGEGGGGGVFVIGATNRPDLLDQALLRPGRFDKMLYLGVSDTHDKQLTILEALTRKFTMHPEMSLRRVADSLPFTYTGADLYALCSDAMLKAITRQSAEVDAKIKALPNGPVSTAYFFDHLATDEDIAVLVTENDFIEAQRELIGSVR